MDGGSHGTDATEGKLHPTLKLLLLAILPAIGSALVGLGKGEHVDDKAEAGYSVTREDVETLKRTVVRLEIKVGALETEIAAVKRAPRFVIGKRTAAPTVIPTAPSPPPPPPPAPPPLPADLNKALEQTQTQAEPVKQ